MTNLCSLVSPSALDGWGALDGIESLDLRGRQRWVVRNWSRVCSATDRSGTRWFIKQFVAADGQRLESLFAAELAASRVLAAQPFDVLRPILPVAAIHDELTIIYEFVDGLVPLHETAEAGDRRIRADLAERLDRLLDDLDRLGHAISDAPLRLGRGAAGAPVGGWKGLDVKNLACAPDGGLVVFDFGPIYRAPLADPASRLLASALMSHWGRPVRLSLAGPPHWVGEVCAPLFAVCSQEAIDARLDRLLAHRMNEPQQAGRLARLAGRSATRILAPSYWRACRRSVRDSAPAALTRAWECS